MDIVAMGEANLSALALHDLGHETLRQEREDDAGRTREAQVASLWPLTTSFAFDAEKTDPLQKRQQQLVSWARLGQAGLDPADKRGCRCLRDGQCSNLMVLEASGGRAGTEPDGGLAAASFRRLCVSPR